MKKLSALVFVWMIFAPLDSMGGVLRVEARIDGHSQLVIQGNSVQWHHIQYTPPGIPANENLPTALNGTSWYPAWPANNCQDCWSSIFRNLCPTLAASSTAAAVNKVDGRDSVNIVQQPSAGNNYTLIVDFSDTDPGADDYIADITYDSDPCAAASIPTLNQWALGAMAILLAVFGISRLRHHNPS